MIARFRPRSSFKRSPRRQFYWDGFFRNQSQAVAANTKTFYIPSTSAVFVAPCTLTAFRGNYVAQINGAANEEVTLGIGLVDLGSDASVLAAACPGPLSDPNHSWIWIEYAHLRQVNAAASTMEELEVVRREINGRAQRKLNNDSVLLMVIETANGVGTAGVRVTVSGRFLFKAG